MTEDTQRRVGFRDERPEGIRQIKTALTNDQIAALVQAKMDKSPFLFAARACGFTFDKVRVTGQRWRPIYDADTYGEAVSVAPTRMLRVNFQCVCRTPETFHMNIDQTPDDVFERGLVEPAEMTARHGSFSEKHLLEDGYAPEFAKTTGRMFQMILQLLRWERLDKIEPDDLQGILGFGFFELTAMRRRRSEHA
ncbi:MAG TPA: hypothetical protein VLE97_01770 [Gaiellaceae bacterium]|nr:hypothetical protein [Gaiellaceae bacterium]